MYKIHRVIHIQNWQILRIIKMCSSYHKYWIVWKKCKYETWWNWVYENQRNPEGWKEHDKSLNSNLYPWTFTYDLWLFPWPIFDLIKRVRPRLLYKERRSSKQQRSLIWGHIKTLFKNFYDPMIDLIGRHWRLWSFQSISSIIHQFINQRKEEKIHTFNKK